MKFCVYHACVPTVHWSEHSIANSEEELIAKIEAGQLYFVAVAFVDALRMQDVFMLTNSIDREWWTNSEIGLLTNPSDGIRSTSVGDVVVDSHGISYLCCARGWKKVNFNVELHANVVEALDHALDNAPEFLAVATDLELAQDMHEYSIELENVDPQELLPHIIAWKKMANQYVEPSTPSDICAALFNKLGVKVKYRT